MFWGGHQEKMDLPHNTALEHHFIDMTFVYSYTSMLGLN